MDKQSFTCPHFVYDHAIHIMFLYSRCWPRHRLPTVTGSVVNVRPDPSTNNDRIGVIYQGTKVEILAQVGEWYNIQFGPVSGWVHKIIFPPVLLWLQ